MWNCPKCESTVDDSLEICGSCGTPPGGKRGRSRTDASRVGTIPGSPDSDLARELDDEFGPPPSAWVEYYRNSDQTDVALMAQHLESHGIRTCQIQEHRLISGLAMLHISGILIREKDIPQANQFIERIMRRRAKRQRPKEFPWETFAPIGFIALTLCTVAGDLIGRGIGGGTDWELICKRLGGALGFIVALSLMIQLYRARKRAESEVSVANP